MATTSLSGRHLSTEAGGGGGDSVDPSWLQTLLRMCLSPEQGHISLLASGFAFGADSLGVSWCASIALGTAVVRSVATVGPPLLARAVTRQRWFLYELKERLRECDQRLSLLAAHEARRRSWSLAERDAYLRRLRADSPDMHRLAGEFATHQAAIDLAAVALQAGVFVCASAAVRSLCSSGGRVHPAWLCSLDPWCALPLATVVLNFVNFFWPTLQTGRPRQPIPLPGGLPALSPAVLTAGFALVNGLLLYFGWHYAPAGVALYWCCSAAHQTLLLAGMAAYQRWLRPPPPQSPA